MENLRQGGLGKSGVHLFPHSRVTVPLLTTTHSPSHPLSPPVSPSLLASQPRPRFHPPYTHPLPPINSRLHLQPPFNP